MGQKVFCVAILVKFMMRPIGRKVAYWRLFYDYCCFFMVILSTILHFHIVGCYLLSATAHNLIHYYCCNLAKISTAVAIIFCIEKL